MENHFMRRILELEADLKTERKRANNLQEENYKLAHANAKLWETVLNLKKQYAA